MSQSHAETQRIEAAYDAVEGHLRTPRSGLLWYWHLGHLLQMTRPETVYGSAWLRAVKGRTGLSRSTVYKTVQFTKVCAEAEAARWDRLVSWSHMAVLLSVKEERQRTAILTDAVGGGWGSRGAGAAVGRLHADRVPSGGRPPRQPVSKGAARNVAALVSTVAGARARIRAVAASLAALRDRRRPIPSRMRCKLDQLQAEADLLQTDLASFVAELDEVLRQDDARRDPPPSPSACA